MEVVSTMPGAEPLAKQVEDLLVQFYSELQDGELEGIQGAVIVYWDAEQGVHYERTPSVSSNEVVVAGAYLQLNEQLRSMYIDDEDDDIG